MQTSLADFVRDTELGTEAERILRACVHCGFCNATCPTYQVLGNELDSPRGRIYLIKQALEGELVTQKTLTHLDRCLTCRNCETTCPSGVQYAHLVDIGRAVVEDKVKRPWMDRARRWGIKQLFSRAWVVSFLLALGRTVRPWLPVKQQLVIPLQRSSGSWPKPRHPRKMLTLSGCVQAAAAPQINVAAAKLLDRLGISLIETTASGCCGALEFHLNDQERGINRARENINAWIEALDNGVEAIVMSASGCGAMVKDYAYLLRNDPQYATKAKRVVKATKDLFEVLATEPLDAISMTGAHRKEPSIAYHIPCTLQHGQSLGTLSTDVLHRLGFKPSPVHDSHLCCGSAGSYSLLQPKLSKTLRQRKTQALEATGAKVIVTANIGCLMHLQAGTALPVRHWAEVVAEHL